MPLNTIAIYANPTCTPTRVVTNTSLGGLSVLTSVNQTSCVPQACTPDTTRNISTAIMCDVTDDRTFASLQFFSANFVGLATFLDAQCASVFTSVWVRGDGVCYSLGNTSVRATVAQSAAGIISASMRRWSSSGNCQGDFQETSDFPGTCVSSVGLGARASVAINGSYLTTGGSVMKSAAKKVTATCGLIVMSVAILGVILSSLALGYAV
ncbi:hypothetical protein DFJ73DRAFT_859557 [Zopfochytrium polystomum]|nr:hypothetical protein DFJ73DRAFT_859557 [Zopfochytrium polystomum]